MRSFLTALIVQVAVESTFPDPTGTSWGDLLAALADVATAVRARFTAGPGLAPITGRAGRKSAW